MRVNVSGKENTNPKRSATGLLKSVATGKVKWYFEVICLGILTTSVDMLNAPYRLDATLECLLAHAVILLHVA